MTTLPCAFCGGDGWHADDRPIPTPQGPCYGPDIRCTACNGEGEYEAELEAIDEADCWPEWAVETAERRARARAFSRAMFASCPEVQAAIKTSGGAGERDAL